ncbi:hypothetical protein AMS68_001982 [Peltaster fructicola]|uniref:Uncharacterized protein n=1 Tax=Peltaster fructicola TaxID=286661 RepID=A0A6H0XPA6_9PEZI|nr:hypothetical protein AMS68_001982 [Peltaster fructicola]
MAAIPPGLLRSGAALQSTSLVENPASQLPGGACNFRELARGTKSPVCGCKRFWLNGATATAEHDNAWCFCGHHACFHNAVSQQSQRLSTPSSTLPRIEAVPTDLVRRTPEGYVSVQQAELLAAPAGLGIRPDSRSQSQSINTRVWEALNGFARQQEGEPYSGRTSQLPSTAVSVVGGTQDVGRVMGPPVKIPPTTVTRPGAEDFQGSATEVATPSIAGTPDPQAFLPPGSQAKRSPGRQAEFAQLEVSQRAGNTQSGPSLSNHEVMNLLRAHANRLDALESMSFSHVPVEEVNEKFEFFDSRLLDLEQWRVESEASVKTSHDERPSRKRRLLPAETSSFASDESFDITAAAHAEAAVLATIATNAEIGPRIEMLENRVNDLERAALPSFSNPWKVQVVLLPWGRDLRGIWFPSFDVTQQSITSPADADEWTGAQSQVKTSFRSSSSDAWTTESIQAWAENAQDWLSPKACGPSGTVYQRLASRGMVREVVFTAADSRHILDVLTATFKHVLPSSKSNVHADWKKYQALQTPFLPLRKVRKSTRLRFLSHAEMVTSATWTAGFLESSVFMKVGDGQRRLYITTPSAYQQADNEGFTWQQIRHLPARDASGNEQAGQIDSSVAIEACWSYNDKIDHVPSLHSSFGSYVSQAAWSTKSQQSIDHGMVGQLTPALSGPEHKRSNSLPSSASVHDGVRTVLPKRRVTSFETGSAVPLVLNTSTESTKRRRLSNSQEAERRGVNFTPRWSREPPSPFYSEHAAENRSEEISGRKRGNTPFAYATPHSNNHFTNPMEVVGDGDTERDSEVCQSDDENEEEWNGMDAAAATSTGGAYVDEDDDEFMDEEDMP